METDQGFAGFIAVDHVHIRPTIAKEIEGKFPEYQHIFPTKKPKSIISVNAKQLEKLAKFFAGLSKLGNVTIKTYGAHDPILFEAHNEVQTARALLMPLRQS